MDAVRDEQIPWKLSDIVWSILAGLGLGMALGIAGTIAVVLSGTDPSDAIPISLVTALFYVGMFSGAYLLIVRRRQVSLRDIGFVPVSGKTLGLMVPAYLGLAILVGIMITVSSPLIGEPPSANRQLALEEEVSLSLPETVLLFIDVAILVPVVEELYFRGLIYRYLRGRWGVTRAIVVSAVLFAVLHPYLPLLPAILVIGVVLALVAERYESLYPSVVLHGLTNGVAVIALAAT